MQCTYIFFAALLTPSSFFLITVGDVIIRDTFVISVASGQKKGAQADTKTSPDMTQLSGSAQTIEQKQTTPHGPTTPSDLPLKNGKALRNGREIEGTF